MTHDVTVALAGVALRVRSTSAAVADAFAARYDAADASALGGPTCEMAVTVTRDGPDPDDSLRVDWRFPDASHSVVAGPGFTAAADLDAGVATVSLHQRLVDGHPLFRRTILEGIPLHLITRKDRHPVHAAAVRAGDAVLLLHGPSGTGKSTLAYVAYRAGLDVLADDSSRVQLKPTLRVWGEGRTSYLHLLPRARDEFAELRTLEPGWLSAGGETKLSVKIQLRERDLFATRARVCLLTRGAGGITRHVVDADAIRRALLGAPEVEADLAPAQRVRAADALSVNGGWRLNLTSNPMDAVPQLREMLAELRG